MSKDNWEDYLTEVLYLFSQITGGLLDVDRVPFKAIMFHWNRRDTAYMAADTISLDIETQAIAGGVA